MSRGSLLAVASVLLLSFFAPRSTHADYYFVGPDNGLWSDPNNWSLTDGGPGGADVPRSTGSNSFRIYLKSGTPKTIIYDVTVDPQTAGSGSIYVGSAAGDPVTLSQTTGNFFSFGGLVVYSQATSIQTSGTNRYEQIDISGTLQLGGTVRTNYFGAG